MVSPDGDVTITNDGATIPITWTCSTRSRSSSWSCHSPRINEIGDGTTGVVVLAGALLEQAEILLDKGIHAIKIADGFEQACDVAVAHLAAIADTVEFDKRQPQTADRDCRDYPVVQDCQQVQI